MSQGPYGCHDRAPFKDKLLVQDGWIDVPPDGFGVPSRVPRWKTIPFRNAPTCVYTTSDLGQVDSRCTGCRHAAGLLQAPATSQGAPA